MSHLFNFSQFGFPRCQLMDTLAKVLKYAQSNKHVLDSLDVIERNIIKYGLENTCVSFNGGKDCTAIVHLVYSVAKKLSHNNNEQRLQAFYAQLPDHFEEESVFVRQAVIRYNLNLMQYSKGSLKDSLNQFKLDKSKIEAIFIGARRDDFKADTIMSVVAPTDPDWPRFIRINPILDWSYHQVWDYIRHLDVPYCDLYNLGYSSIGTKKDTKKNSSLSRYDSEGKLYYAPAWELNESCEERSSRSIPPKQSCSSRTMPSDPNAR